MVQNNDKWPISLVYVSKPLSDKTVITATTWAKWSKGFARSWTTCMVIDTWVKLISCTWPFSSNPKWLLRIIKQTKKQISLLKFPMHEKCKGKTNKQTNKYTTFPNCECNFWSSGFQHRSVRDIVHETIKSICYGRFIGRTTRQMRVLLWNFVCVLLPFSSPEGMQWMHLNIKFIVPLR